MNAITKFDEDLTLIRKRSIKINNKMREEYELDEREKSNIILRINNMASIMDKLKKNST